MTGDLNCFYRLFYQLTLIAAKDEFTPRSARHRVVRGYRQHKYLVNSLQAAHHHLVNSADRCGPAKILLEVLSLLLGDGIAVYLRNGIGHHRAPN